MKTSKVFLLIFAFCSLSQAAFGQEDFKTKKVTEEYTSPFEYKETFQVLEKDKFTKHGWYKKYYKWGSILCEGNYTMGQKNGVWSFYNSNKSITYQFDFDRNQLVESSLHKELKNKETTIIFKDGKEGKIIVDRIAFCKKGEAELMAIIANTLNYPAEARENGIEGVVNIDLYINEAGFMEVIGVSKSVHPSLDNESLRTLHQLSTQIEWFPAIKDGEVFESIITLPLKFKLS